MPRYVESGEPILPPGPARHKTLASKAKNAHIAMILQPTQWKAPERQYTDHIVEITRQIKLPIAMRISAPYETEQYNAQMVEWAKEHRQLLVISREIVVWSAK